MFAPFRWFDDNGAQGMEVRVEVGVWHLRHLTIAGSIDGGPNRLSLSFFLEWNDDLLAVLLHRKLEGRQEGARVLRQGRDVEDAPFPVVRQLDSGDVLTLLGEPLHHLRDSDSPLRWDPTLSREVEGEFPGCHCCRCCCRRCCRRG